MSERKKRRNKQRRRRRRMFMHRKHSDTGVCSHHSRHMETLHSHRQSSPFFKPRNAWLVMTEFRGDLLMSYTSIPSNTVTLFLGTKAHTHTHTEFAFLPSHHPHCHKRRGKTLFGFRKQINSCVGDQQWELAESFWQHCCSSPKSVFWKLVLESRECSR